MADATRDIEAERAQEATFLRGSDGRLEAGILRGDGRTLTLVCGPLVSGRRRWLIEVDPCAGSPSPQS